jgi:hypothetical protein
MVRIIEIENGQSTDTRKIAHMWWLRTMPQCEQFFSLTSLFASSYPTVDYLMKLQEAYIRFERAPYPQVVIEAREMLLESMATAVAGATMSLAGNDERARQLISRSRQQLIACRRALAVLGVQFG